MRQEFISAIQKNQQTFGLDLQQETVAKLADYFDIVMQANPLLHLVAPCPPEEFARRHILESLTLLEFFPEGAGIVDVGAGAGLPSIPCLVARDDLRGALIESKEKKANFLKSTCDQLGLTERVLVINKQFSEVPAPNMQFVTSRALDKFINNLPRLLRWGKGRRFVLFGGNSMRDALNAKGINFRERLMPLSDQRFLFSF